MSTISQNVDLLPYNTFKIRATARYFTSVSNVDDVKSIFDSELFQKHKHLIIGGGSNLLLTGDFNGLVIKNDIKGINVVQENEDTIMLKVGAGENWHKFVMYCVDRNYGGVENLSLIPGTIGAAPMQNIGAYGVEIKEVIHTVEAIEISTGDVRVFSNAECQFGYRESIFKHELKNKYFISSITLSLTKKNHRFNTTYGAITDVLKQNHNNEVSVKNISDAVVFIRKTKLPDPEVIGNAGSFFKNPSVEHSVFDRIKVDFPSVPSFPGENGLVKVPAGWLIEQCGWKGKTIENIGVHKHQALVLVNYGGGDGSKIWDLAMKIQSSVKEKFNITLHPEVNVI
ncbi:UDP-N-acetylmuramate dehydrogenase [Chryseosolibacter indicus]|uniref:UDP-N-acetylenolpyruvoylglucosamine reductase n=1 Tax=Chryseosolibacter indicus TaxID=2782351 RepID=A0ABS5VVG2_9BACT|nr:UDP-N-acetylmuramate dehydrogenase [Chryseosolibacter indicus]MBT1705206.1 UDP-N-acetylmuramate dehydrogenase [Chryseosolibacter indicus]